jgi:hypothetical protein
VSDVLAEQFDILSRVPLTHSVFVGQMKPYRQKGFAIGVAPSSLSASPTQPSLAARPKPRVRQERTNPNGIMAPLNWELAVVNYETETPDEPSSSPARESAMQASAAVSQHIKQHRTVSRGSAGAGSTRAVERADEHRLKRVRKNKKTDESCESDE